MNRYPVFVGRFLATEIGPPLNDGGRNVVPRYQEGESETDGTRTRDEDGGGWSGG